VSSFDVFNCHFPLHVQNEIQVVCLLGFWLINAPLVKVFENELTHFTLLDA